MKNIYLMLKNVLVLNKYEFVCCNIVNDVSFEVWGGGIFV